MRVAPLRSTVAAARQPFAEQRGDRQRTSDTHATYSYVPYRERDGRLGRTSRDAPQNVTTPAADAGALERVMFEIKRVIVGQERMVERMMVSLLARGHCLLEGVPGVAKTLAVETLARTVTARSRALQFTPDLVPSDIVGTRIYRPVVERFDTELGPVMANFVLTDEINNVDRRSQTIEPFLPDSIPCEYARLVWCGSDLWRRL